MKKIANCKIYSVLVGSTPIDCIAGVFVRVIAMLLNRSTELQIAERLWPVKGRGFNFYSPQFSSVINSKMAAKHREEQSLRPVVMVAKFLDLKKSWLCKYDKKRRKN